MQPGSFAFGRKLSLSLAVRDSVCAMACECSNSASFSRCWLYP